MCMSVGDGEEERKWGKGRRMGGEREREATEETGFPTLCSAFSAAVSYMIRTCPWARSATFFLFSLFYYSFICTHTHMCNASSLAAPFRIRGSLSKRGKNSGRDGKKNEFYFLPCTLCPRPQFYKGKRVSHTLLSISRSSSLHGNGIPLSFGLSYILYYLLIYTIFFRCPLLLLRPHIYICHSSLTVHAAFF